MTIGGWTLGALVHIYVHVPIAPSSITYYNAITMVPIIQLLCALHFSINKDCIGTIPRKKKGIERSRYLFSFFSLLPAFNSTTFITHFVLLQYTFHLAHASLLLLYLLYAATNSLEFNNHSHHAL